jgi:nicotinamide mononucleotide transporter
MTMTAVIIAAVATDAGAVVGSSFPAAAAVAGPEEAASAAAVVASVVLAAAASAAAEPEVAGNPLPMPEIWENIRLAALKQGPLEWVAVLLSIIYVVLAARENKWCWWFGLVSVILYFFLFLRVRLYSDAILQVFYAAMSVYGWFSWNRSEDRLEHIAITTWPAKNHLLAILSGFLFALLWGKIWSQFGAALPYIDAFTTVFAVITTFMVARKVLENWLYWIVIDLVATGVYINREMYLTAFLFLIYTFIALSGWLRWRKDYFKNSRSSA